MPDQNSQYWSLDIKLSFQSAEVPAKLTLYIPKSSNQFSLVDENFISRGFGLSTFNEDGNRIATWSTRKTPGKHTLFYRGLLLPLNNSSPTIVVKKPDIQTYEFQGPHQTAAETVIEEVKKESADLPSMVAALLKKINREIPEENINILLGSGKTNKNKTLWHKALLASRLMNKLGIPARIVNGIELKEQSKKIEVTQWLEVFEKKSWEAFALQTGTKLQSEEYLALWRGDEKIVKTSGVSDVKVDIALTKAEETEINSAILQAKTSNPILVDFSIFALPIQTQEVFRIALMVPVGALIVVLLRNLIGIKTFGTFMPVLIALAFRETQLLWGVLLLIMVLIVGLSVRFYLEHLKLLMVPRLAAVLTIVVLAMLFISIICHKLDIENGLSLALFPMIVITMTIERMSIIWEELGGSEAIKNAISSLFAAIIVYFVITDQFVIHLFFVFPELHLSIIALMLLMGRYTGYRLLELKRFKSILSQ